MPIPQPEDEFGGLKAAARQFESSWQEAESLMGDLTYEQVNWRRAGGQWSIGQCLLHLAQGTNQVLPAIDRAITDARARGLLSPGPFRYGWFARWMTRSMEPPPKRRMRTSKIFVPPATPVPGDYVLRTFTDSRYRIIDRVRAAEGVDLKRAIVVSPVSRLIRMPLGAYFAFLAAHDRRHFWQAWRIKQAIVH